MTSLVESYFGLKRPPFSISKSRGPVFMTESLRASALFLRRGLAERASILAVTGPAGIGKSSLVRSLPKLIGTDWRIASISGRVRSWEEMRQVLLHEFEIGRDRITRAGIEEACAKYGKLLIVVDDAQFLTPDLLERICIMPQLRNEQDVPAVQIVLLADLDAVSREYIRPLLAWLEAKDRHIMQPLPLEDVHRYIHTRMRRSGWQGEPLVCESGAGALHRLSRGNPRRLSSVCTEILEQAASRGLARIDAEFVVGCSSADLLETGEPLTPPSGAGRGGVTGGETRGQKSSELELDSWDPRFQRAPLTAENVAAAPSLELAKVAESLSELYSHKAPIESMRSASRPQMRTKPTHFKPGATHRRSRSKRRNLLALGFCALVTSAAVLSARSEIADLLREFGSNLLTAADVVESVRIRGDARAAAPAGAVERSVAEQLLPVSAFARY